jgi:hypothetical protein
MASRDDKRTCANPPKQHQRRQNNFLATIRQTLSLEALPAAHCTCGISRTGTWRVEIGFPEAISGTPKVIPGTPKVALGDPKVVSGVRKMTGDCPEIAKTRHLRKEYPF